METDVALGTDTEVGESQRMDGTVILDDQAYFVPFPGFGKRDDGPDLSEFVPKTKGSSLFWQ